MTSQILQWLQEIVLPLRHNFGEVFEIGALNVNGSAREVLQRRAASWIGCDKVEGSCVDLVGDAVKAMGHRRFDAIVACECYEHDPQFWMTNEAARSALKIGGVYVVTFPTIGFPFHDYGGDYYRFTEMALRDVFFAGMAVVDIRAIGTDSHPCIAGCAMKIPSSEAEL